MYLYSIVPSIGLEGQPFGLAPYSLISLRNCSKGAIRYEIREVFPGHFGAQATVRVADLTAWTGPVTVNAGFYLEKLTVHSQTLSGSNFVKLLLIQFRSTFSTTYTTISSIKRSPATRWPYDNVLNAHSRALCTPI